MVRRNGIDRGNKQVKEKIQYTSQMFKVTQYSASKDATFCLWCYLFPTGNRHGDEVFINHGFKNWKKAFENFRDHEGGLNNRHNHARVQFELFKDQRHNLDNVLSQQCEQDEIVYRVRLTAVVDVIRFLLKQGLALRGHEVSIISNSLGKFLELVKWYCERNNELTSPKIQKEIVNACVTEEQMAVVLRYVDDGGEVIKRFVGLQLVVVATSSEYASVSSFSDYLTKIVNLVGASCKRKDLIRQKQHDDFVKRIETSEVCTGKGKNQEMSLA
ncbi:uncharacterized protein LOC143534904 [Bidens hawaiensis]|uniref:uncharacterized protein LOC143534904 n=1 Tax=Bidens hawaiensis TaxID=980011 RepID=UPI00404AA1CA